MTRTLHASGNLFCTSKNQELANGVFLKDDTNIDSDKCLAFVGTGNKEAAKEGAKAAVEAAKANGWDEIKCIEIAGVQGDSTNTARMDGSRHWLSGLPAMVTADHATIWLSPCSPSA